MRIKRSSVTRVAQVLPDIPGLGGLATRTYNQHNIFNSLEGVKADFFRLTRKQSNNYLHLDDNTLGISASSSGLKLSQYDVSYHPKMIEETLAILNRYDVLWFNHACPHLNTDDGTEESKYWQRIFTETKGKKLVVISDVYMRKYYPWILDVKDSIDIVLGIGHGHARSVKGDLEVEGILKHPFFLPKKVTTTNKRAGIVWSHQWREWKGTKKFLLMINGVREPVHFFGTGREYYMLRKGEPQLFKRVLGNDAISKKTWNPKSWHIVHGTVDPDVVLGFLDVSKLAFDLTGITGGKYIGHYNRATLEPMLHGCVSVCTPALIKPHTHIPKDCVYVLKAKNVSQATKEINSLLKDKSKRVDIANRAFRWIKKEHDGKKILGEWIKRLTKRR